MRPDQTQTNPTSIVRVREKDAKLYAQEKIHSNPHHHLTKLKLEASGLPRSCRCMFTQALLRRNPISTTAIGCARRMSSATNEAVYVEKCYDGKVWTVVLNRPKHRNAVNGPCAKLLYETFTKFDQDETARVAVLWGANGTFCAGADLKAVASKDEANPLMPHGMGPMVSMELDSCCSVYSCSTCFWYGLHA